MDAFSVRVAGFGVTAAVVAACGGGYGGGGSSGSAGSYGGGSPTPTVAFTAPMQATTINFGQAVKLAWTSTNASSCAASTSNTVGGFTGSQPASGEATVAPAGAGSITYTLTCSGAGGTASATSAVVTVNPSILSGLATARIATIGSTLDPMERGGNPYGLALAPTTAGLLTVGDLVVRNFKDGASNTEGRGTTIVGLHPTPGATPYRIAQSSTLQGCNALAMLPDGTIFLLRFMSPMSAARSAASR